jgi:hypothetical protein
VEKKYGRKLLEVECHQRCSQNKGNGAKKLLQGVKKNIMYMRGEKTIRQGKKILVG